MKNESKEMSNYFSEIERKIKKEYNLATGAKKKGFDTDDFVDIKIAKDMNERVIGLISTIAKIDGSKLILRIKELEEEYFSQAWEVALKISGEVARGKFGDFGSVKKNMEVGIRVGMTYNTLGIVAAPLEGFIGIKIKERRDGGKYIAIEYAGPIRGAGGTASAFSLLIADYVRSELGFLKYDPSEEEISRFVREVYDYHERITNLQYLPSEEELRFLIKNIPVELSGEPTERIQVSNFKDLPRISTNQIRGGMCLVLSEGISQKAVKISKRVNNFSKEFGIDWEFLNEFTQIQKKHKAKQGKNSEGTKQDKNSEGTKNENNIKINGSIISPNYTYIKDLVAGRPVFGFPLVNGGFRLRYGRARNTGFSCVGINPATMWIVNQFIGIGTQLKIERPGKAASAVPVDSIEGPIVLLSNGSVIKLNTLKDAKKYFDRIKKIIYLGDMLINYGDFSENNHTLIPSGYCSEWWALEFKKASIKKFNTNTPDILSRELGIKKGTINHILNDNFYSGISFLDSVKISSKLMIPLHPEYTLFWTVLFKEELKFLVKEILTAKVVKENGEITKSIFKTSNQLKVILQKLGVSYILSSGEFIVINSEFTHSLFYPLGLIDRSKGKEVQGMVDDFCLGTQGGEKDKGNDRKNNAENGCEFEFGSVIKNNLEILALLKKLSDIKIRDKSGTFIGARMGRPEKAKQRKLQGSPHVIFPLYEEGGKTNNFQSAILQKKVTGKFALNYCVECKRDEIYDYCIQCKKRVTKKYLCLNCKPYKKNKDEKEKLVLLDSSKCDKCGDKARIVRSYSKEIIIEEYFKDALNISKLKEIPELVKGFNTIDNYEGAIEHITKGIFRAKNDVYVNKDGSIRYDMTELPLTHFTPKEVSVKVSKLVELGYKFDITGKALVGDEQILELKPQDIVIPNSKDLPEESGADVLFRVANFIDDILVHMYGLKKHYRLKNNSDLVGQYIIGLAPHISSGMVGRIIGFSKTQAIFAHPLFHAALRRDCDGDECSISLALDMFLNFSRKYLPDRRGARTMDAPLVLSTKLIPSEVDDMVFGIDIVLEYTLEFYEAAQNYAKPADVNIKQLKMELGTPKQYEGILFTTPTTSINDSVNISAYKLLSSMEDKLKSQMNLAEKICSVSATKVAELVINKHFLKDIKGNFRRFFLQRFRCVTCLEKFRRPPLVGKCTKCGGKIIFTVSEGSISKYLEPSISLAKKYNVSPYIKQSLDLVEKAHASIFGRKDLDQAELADWFNNDNNRKEDINLKDDSRILTFEELENF